jgi:Dyp-type peroxidase family
MSYCSVLRSELIRQLQEGIYLKNKPTVGKSLCTVFFRISEDSTASEVGKAISQLWNMYSELKQGVIKNLTVNRKLLLGGNLSVLLGYGPKIFKVVGIKKLAPVDLLENSFFESPRRWADGSVSEHSQLIYSKEISENHAASDHFMIQLIADGEFFSSRALVQTLRELRDINSGLGKRILQISKWYTGFQSEDKRNWLGFHDGISNIKSNERFKAVAINDTKRLGPDDKWLLGGTYLAFLRITVDIDSWDRLNLYDQEIIIGRDKLTGCPIIGVDRDGKPIKAQGCPVSGTFEIIQDGNEYFREHPSYGMQRNLPYHVNDSILKNSHIARSLDVNLAKQRNTEPGRIFRQGFQFLESQNEIPGFRVGLNFISFQNNPKNLFSVIDRKPNLMLDDQKSVPPLENFLSVHSAGIFIVPPVVTHEKFPGSNMFFE